MTEAILAMALFVQRYRIAVQKTEPVLLPIGLGSTRGSRTPALPFQPSKYAMTAVIIENAN